MKNLTELIREGPALVFSRSLRRDSFAERQLPAPSTPQLGHPERDLGSYRVGGSRKTKKRGPEKKMA